MYTCTYVLYLINIYIYKPLSCFLNSIQHILLLVAYKIFYDTTHLVSFNPFLYYIITLKY